QRARVAAVDPGAQHLAQLPQHLGLTDLTKVDAPFAVVACGRHVVVAGIHIADLIRGPSCLHERAAHYPLRPAMNAYLQLDQPPGVPPLELTGERTLPDVPAENYWYRRHLVVYEWIAARIAGARVLEMACGEGYGADVLARSGARSVVGLDANPEAFEHARLRYVRPNLSFARGLVETFGEQGAYDAVTFLQTIEHV